MPLPGIYPARAPIGVEFAYDEDGIIHVQVTDLTANQLLGELEIVREANLSADEVQGLQLATEGVEVE